VWASALIVTLTNQIHCRLRTVADVHVCQVSNVVTQVLLTWHG